MAGRNVAVAWHKFGVLGVHDLKAKVAEKGVAFARECRIFEVCKPHQAQKVPEANLASSTALPCRSRSTRRADYEAGHDQADGTDRAVRDPRGQGVAEDVETTLERIMAEAAR